MEPHTLSYVESLLEIAQGDGGHMLTVIGESSTPGVYWAGSRFAPVKTLFEAVLRCVLSGSYEHIVVFTGHGSGHLPNWHIGPNFRLGDEAMIWVVRGQGNIRSKQKSVKPLRSWEETTLDDLQPYISEDINRLLWRSENTAYWRRLEAYIEYRDKEIGRVGDRRGALVLDYLFLVPTPDETLSMRDMAINQRQLNDIRSKIKRQLQGTSLDLILIAEDGTALDLLQDKKSGEPSIIAQVMAASLGEFDWRQFGAKLQAVMPHLCIGQDVQIVEAPRLSSPLPGLLLEMDQSNKSPKLYDILRSAHINRRPARPMPPRRADEIALEFWANIDLTPLKTAFDEKIIGQSKAKSIVLGILEQHRQKCADLITRSPPARRTARDLDFCLPAIGFFGAAGMGKTTMCNVIVDNLFGDEQFGRLIDLAGKNLKVATIGVEPPMEGCGNESDLISFARQTRGLGVICFDEFTRIALPQNMTLANALGPLLEILQARRFEPSHPKFRPSSRFFHLANTLFIFSGNVSQSGKQAPHGFCSIDELGPAFTRRVTVPIYFESLNVKDYREATQRALEQAARNWAKSFDDAGKFANLTVIVDERLIDAIDERLNQVTQEMGEEPSISRLNSLVSNLPYGKSFDAGRAHDGITVVLDINLIPKEWSI